MPSQGEHICILKDPKTVTVIGSRQRKAKNGKVFKILFGIPKRGSGSVEQAYMYLKNVWSVKEAQIHCKQFGGQFKTSLIRDAASRLIEAVRKK